MSRIRLYTNKVVPDGIEFIITRKAAELSKTIKYYLEALGDISEIISIENENLIDSDPEVLKTFAMWLSFHGNEANFPDILKPFIRNKVISKLSKMATYEYSEFDQLLLRPLSISRLYELLSLVNIFEIVPFEDESGSTRYAFSELVSLEIAKRFEETRGREEEILKLILGDSSEFGGSASAAVLV